MATRRVATHLLALTAATLWATAARAIPVPGGGAPAPSPGGGGERGGGCGDNTLPPSDSPYPDPHRSGGRGDDPAAVAAESDGGATGGAAGAAGAAGDGASADVAPPGPADAGCSAAHRSPAGPWLLLLLAFGVGLAGRRSPAVGRRSGP